MNSSPFYSRVSFWFSACTRLLLYCYYLFWLRSSDCCVRGNILLPLFVTVPTTMTTMDAYYTLRTSFRLWFLFLLVCHRRLFHLWGEFVCVGFALLISASDRRRVIEVDSILPKRQISLFSDHNWEQRKFEFINKWPPVRLFLCLVGSDAWKQWTLISMGIINFGTPKRRAITLFFCKMESIQRNVNLFQLPNGDTSNRLVRKAWSIGILAAHQRNDENKWMLCAQNLHSAHTQRLINAEATLVCGARIANIAQWHIISSDVIITTFSTEDSLSVAAYGPQASCQAKPDILIWNDLSRIHSSHSQSLKNPFRK